MVNDAHCHSFVRFIALMVAEAMADGFGHNHTENANKCVEFGETLFGIIIHVAE